MAFLDKLLPCPFCGGKAKLETWDYEDMSYSYGFIECTKCAARTEWERLGGDGVHDPVALHLLEARWNRRWSGCQTE